jgi:hypothetical protein
MQGWFIAGGQGRLQGQVLRGLYVLLRARQVDSASPACGFSEAASWITGQTNPVNGGYSFAGRLPWKPIRFPIHQLFHGRRAPAMPLNRG